MTDWIYEWTGFTAEEYAEQGRRLRAVRNSAWFKASFEALLAKYWRDPDFAFERDFACFGGREWGAAA